MSIKRLYVQLLVSVYPKGYQRDRDGTGRDLLSGYTEWFEALSEEDVLLFTLDSLYE